MAAPESRKICFCYDVSESEILNCIQNGACTIQDIRARTRASTGCGGCEYEVEELLEQNVDLKTESC